MLTVIAGIIMLGILVFVHELGHFCVAKLMGVKVLKFSLGFGPRLVSRTWGETEYMICAVPLGGYVQMLGEGGGADGEKTELSPEDKARSYADKPPGRRMAIVAAGPAMNLILPFIILPIAFMVGVNLPSYWDEKPCIGYVQPESAAAEAGFEDGDCIETINGVEVESWNEAGKKLISFAGSPLRFTVEGSEGARQIVLPADKSDLELQALGLFPEQTARIGSLAAGMPAAESGLQEGDLIVSVGGESIDSWYELRRAIQKTEGESTAVTVERDGQSHEYTIEPEAQEQGGDYLIGIAPAQELITKRFGPVEALQAGSQRAFDLIELTVVFIQKLFSGNVSTKNIGGPITVVQVAGQAAQTDVSSILSVLAFLSIQLGILNLLPIPILDGGHIIFNLFEIIFRRPLSMRTREIAQQIGLILLVLLMILAFYNDIARLLVG